MEAARTAQRDDLDALAALVESAIGEKADQRGGPLWIRQRSRAGRIRASIEDDLADDDVAVLVGTLDGVVLGYACCRLERLADGDRLGVLEELFVEEEARGVGLGEALMDEVIAWCTDRDCLGVDSLALPGDRNTKNFYESFGLVARAIVVHRSLR